VQARGSDDGVCLGAALAPSSDNGGKLPMHKICGMRTSARKTPTKKSKKALTTYKLRATRVADPAAAAARNVANEKSSVGSRAGWNSAASARARSILADPRDPK